MATLAELLEKPPDQKSRWKRLADKLDPSFGLPDQLPMQGRFNFLPLRQTDWPMMGNKEWAVPGVLASMYNAFTAPGRAVQGKIPESQLPAEALNFAGNMMLDSWAASRAAPVAEPNSQDVGITMYHGSPHKFEQFDSSKIGTGEGAQAYGHGLYFAENPSVANEYAKNVSGDFMELPNGQMFDPSSLQHLNVRSLARRGDLDAAIAKASEIANSSSPVAKEAASDLSVLSSIKAGGGWSMPKGAMYSVDIPDEAYARMLYWDKPLSQQPVSVKSAFNQLVSDKIKTRSIGNDLVDVTINGESVGVFTTSKVPDVLNNIADYTPLKGELLYKQFGDDPVKASNALMDAGIPGIRYLDAGSRAGGQGTSNVVLFDDKLVKILEKK